MMKGPFLGLMGLVLLCGGTHANADISAGLAASFPFNGNANDVSGNGNNGVVYGATLIADRSGNPNSAYSFDGVDDYVRTTDSQSLNITGDLTISAWIRASDSTKTIFGNMLEVSPHSGYSLKVDFTGVACFWSGDKILLGQTYLATDSWTHVAATLSGTNAALYVNGVLDASGTVGVPTSSNVDQTIGASYTPFYFFNGGIDDVRVYHRALSFSEIGELHTVPEPTTLALFVIGALSLLGYAWRHRRQTA
jgi:hypothetical protein